MFTKNNLFFLKKWKKLITEKLSGTFCPNLLDIFEIVRIANINANFRQ